MDKDCHAEYTLVSSWHTQEHSHPVQVFVNKSGENNAAFALNLLDALIPKEVQRISNIKGSNGKTPLNTSILAAIKGNNPCLCHSQDSML